jgi:glycosyltransferase involved in cell wall biosynthesis
MHTPPAAWHILAGAYPPGPGGVADYTSLVAHALVDEGERVHVWTAGHEGDDHERERLVIHRRMGRWHPADLRDAGRAMDALAGPRRLLLQWVPHGFGMRAFNVAVPLWLHRRARIDRLHVMVHEAGSPFRGRPIDHARAFTHRLMATTLQARARRLYFSTPAALRVWAPWRPASSSATSAWVPVPSNIVPVADAGVVAQVRARAAGAPIVGHFGTFGDLIARPLDRALARVIDDVPHAHVLLVGPGSAAFRDALLAARPAAASRVTATGGLPAAEVSAHVAAADLMLQPYPDGISTRRGTGMACIAHGRAVVTNEGENTEPLWRERGAVHLVRGDADDAVADAMGAAAVGLLAAAREREALGAAGAALYAERFALAHTIAALRAD